VKPVTISEELLAFRQRVPGCHVIAFADLSTGMVLASCTSEQVTQEKLDALCNSGFDTLFGVNNTGLLQQSQGGSGEAPKAAVVATEAEIQCFVCALHPAQEALCFVISEHLLLDELFEEARSLLHRLVGES
jgi:hypothetical protein